jgi:hypothetical protein
VQIAHNIFLGLAMQHIITIMHQTLSTLRAIRSACGIQLGFGDWNYNEPKYKRVVIYRGND